MLLALLSSEAQVELTKHIDERIALLLNSSFTIPPASPWLTVAEAATHLRTTPGAVYKRICRGQLLAHRPEGSRIMLHRDEINAVLDLRASRSYDDH